MKHLTYLVLSVAFIGFVIGRGHAQSNSVLGNINCGGGQATCFQQPDISLAI
jgi:hypothetical protein